MKKYYKWFYGIMAFAGFIGLIAEPMPTEEVIPIEVFRSFVAVKIASVLIVCFSLYLLGAFSEEFYKTNSKLKKQKR